MTSPISPVTDQNQGSTANTSSLGTAGLLDPSTFLSLLVDELKYQNPLDPTSRFLLSVAPVTGQSNQKAITFSPVYSGHTYTVQASPSLTSPARPEPLWPRSTFSRCRA